MSEQTLNGETRYTLLRRLAENPGASQRQLAKELGISQGKTNYCRVPRHSAVLGNADIQKPKRLKAQQAKRPCA